MLRVNAPNRAKICRRHLRAIAPKANSQIARIEHSVVSGSCDSRTRLCTPPA